MSRIYKKTNFAGSSSASGAVFGGGGGGGGGGSGGGGSTYEKVKSTSSRAFNSAQNSGLTGAHNGEQDAYRHCVATGEISRLTNETTANFAGLYHEITHPNPENERSMDIHNNSIGAKIGSNAISFEAIENACMAAVSDGRLQTSLK